MSKNKLFKLETKEEMLKMKAIYRFINEMGKTPEQVIAEYLSEEEMAELKKLDNKIIIESIKPFITKDIKNKENGQ